MSHLELWRETVSDYYKNKGKTFHVPKKGTDDYDKIKKIYDKRRGKAVKCKKCKKACCCCK